MGWLGPQRPDGLHLDTSTSLWPESGALAIGVRLRGIQVAFQFVQLTDTHLDEPDGLRADQLRCAVREINRLDVAMVLVTGDVAHGSPSVFAAAAKILAGLRVPVHVVRGNHDTDDQDNPEPFHRYLGTGRMAVRHEDCLLVGLDTADGPDLHPDQRAWLDQVLAHRDPDVRRVIAFSHAYLGGPHGGVASPLAACLHERGVACYLCGHQHLNRDSDVAGLRQVVTTCLDPVKSRGTTAGFRVFTVTPDGIRHRFCRVGPTDSGLQSGFYPAVGIAVREPAEHALRLCRERRLGWFQFKGAVTDLDPVQQKAIGASSPVEVSWHLPGLKDIDGDAGDGLADLVHGLALCADLGVGRVTAHVPKVSAERLYDEDSGSLRRTPEAQRMLDVHTRLAEACQAHGVRLCLENNRNDARELARGITCMFGSRPHHLIAVARAVVDRLASGAGSAWDTQQVVGFTLDIGHALGNLSDGRAGWPPHRWMRELAPRVWMIHAHDLTVDGPSQFTHQPIGCADGLASGNLHANWPGIVQAYLRYVPRVPFLVEVAALPDAVRSIDALVPLQLP